MTIKDLKQEERTNWRNIKNNFASYYRACQFRWSENSNPEEDDVKLFASFDEAVQYAENLRCEIGFFPKVDEIAIEVSEFEGIEEFELNELEDLISHNTSLVSIDEVWCGSENEGHLLEGSIIIEWSYEKYPGYARNLLKIGYAGKWPFHNFKWESDLISGNEERTFRSNYSILVEAKELDGLDDVQIKELVDEQLGQEHWRWNYFKNNPNTIDINSYLNLNISDEEE